jgi:hypothetical protein
MNEPGQPFDIENPAAPVTIRDDSIPERLYRLGKPNPGNLKARPGEDGVSFWDTLANPQSHPAGGQPIFPPGKPWFAVDPKRLPNGSVIPTPPQGHWIVKNVPPEQIREAVVERGSSPD